MPAAAGRHAHGIAGAAGNLGAEDLRAAAKALELAGRAGRTDLSELLAAVNERAAVVARSIASLRANPGPGATAAVGQALDRQEARAALERLTAALNDFDLSSASDALAELTTSGVSALASADVERLRQHVDGYDYEAAREVASGLLARIQEHGD
jgi:HPt (histidine-containing phosphotransfer) domain-containing protein